MASKTLGLDQFRKGLDEKHDTTTIEFPEGGKATLRNALRMPKADRDALNKQFNSWRERFPASEESDEDGKPVIDQDAPTPEEEEVCEHLARVIELLVGEGEAADKLLALDIDSSGVELRNNIAALSYIMELHSGAEVGEA